MLHVLNSRSPILSTKSVLTKVQKMEFLFSRNRVLFTLNVVQSSLLQQNVVSRSSQSKLFFKKSVLGRFGNIQKKTLELGSLFSGFQLTTLLKERPQHNSYPVNFAKFLKASFLYNTSMWMHSRTKMTEHACTDKD